MRILSLLVLFSLTSCSWMIPSPKKTPSAKKREYSLKYKNKDWLLVEQDKSDYVFQNNSGTTLVINSFCGEFQDQPLNILALKTFSGLKHIKNRKESPLIISQREAYSLEAEGSLDGVEVNIKVINMRRNNCYYDFLRITPHNSPIVANQPDDLISKVEFIQ